MSCCCVSASLAHQYRQKYVDYIDNHLNVPINQSLPANSSAASLDQRQAELFATMEAMNLSQDVKRQMQAKLKAEESKQVKKMSVYDFETLTIIGRGAFGENSNHTCLSIGITRAPAPFY
jgi:hypothetical protein